MQQSNPILVEVTRGPAVESIHRGAVAVVDRNGNLVESWGDVSRPVYPRSAVKPLQAVPLIASGAAKAFDVSREEIALACASHGGEPVHTLAVDRWLRRLGYSAETLECGAHPPTDGKTRRALIRKNEDPTPLHNNCSGKHAGFLTVCKHLGIDPTGYIQPEHPIQVRIRQYLEIFTDTSLKHAVCSVDGCGIPVFEIPLTAIARAMMKIADPETMDNTTAEAVIAIRESMTAHPYLVAGRHRFCTEIMEKLAPNTVVKTGAEGVFCAAVLDQGIGIALKIDDGATRASEVALGGILRRVNAISDSQFDQLRSKLEPEIQNVAGRKVGVVRASSGLAKSTQPDARIDKQAQDSQAI